MPQPSGSLARWGMVLQDIDLNLHYWPGKANSDADTLSCNAVSGAGDIMVPWIVLTLIEAGVPPVKEGKETLSGRRLGDQNICRHH